MKFKSQYALAIIPLILLGLIVYFFSDIVTYIVFGWVLSMIGGPLNGLLRRAMGRNMSAGLTLVVFLLIFSLLFWVFVPPIIQQTRNLAGIDYTSLVESLEEPINDWNKWLVDRGLMEGEATDESENILPNEYVTEDTGAISDQQIIKLDSVIQQSDTLASNLVLFLTINQPEESQNSINENGINEQDGEANFFDRFKQNLSSFLDPAQIPKLFTSFVGFLGNLVIAIMSIFFIAFFFLREQGLFVRIVSAFVPNEYESQVIHAIDSISNLLGRYFIGIAAQMTIITIFVSIALSLFGLKNALLIGFFAAVMNVIPYIGPIIGATFGIIITISSNLNLGFYDELLPLLLIVMVVFAIMQLLDNFILQPTIFGRSVKAHPLEIFVVVLAGAKIGGILGMILAIPSYTVLRVVAKAFLSEFKVVQRITSRLDS